MHVLFLPPLLLVASGWILGVSPWAVCSPMAGECEGEGEEDENLGVRSSWDAEPRKQVPDSRELVVAGLAGVVGAIPCCLAQSTPYGVPY